MKAVKTIEEARFLKIIARHIRSYTQERHASLERVAYEADVSKAQIYKLARGKTNPSILTLYRIAEVLEIPVWKLLKADD